MRQKLGIYCVAVACTLFSASTSKADGDFQQGYAVISIGNGLTRFYYASASGDVYSRPNVGDWTQPPTYVGNFFPGETTPADFLAGLRAVTVGTAELLYYASANGNVYSRDGNPIGPWTEPPGSEGNFFLGQPVPPDFQAGFRILEANNTRRYYYVAANGDVFEQRPTPWHEPANYVGNFFGSQPVRTTPSTLGGVKARAPSLRGTQRWTPSTSMGRSRLMRN